MKKTICDRCGKEDIGRNSEFKDHLIRLSNADTSMKYIDLCPDCQKKFDDYIKELNNDRDEKVRKFLTNFMSGGEND